MEKITYRAYFSKNLYFSFDKIDIDENRAYFFKKNNCICSYWKKEFEIKYIETIRGLDIETFIIFGIKEI